jgi:hypothetical protein
MTDLFGNPDDPMNSKDHETAMAVRAFMFGLSDVISLAHYEESRHLVECELFHLQFCYDRLGELLRELRMRKAS